eukprot:TRINITY_DN3803_c0_g1_i2.p1 TRINITY_DN3803_c0_g1~~TRINITY_DN3803_c0_g1_i2.p1  ORF type:complete len:656 (+),score=161.12 TRINITY_DN3803_c0_g1_i2:22-1968(+)
MIVLFLIDTSVSMNQMASNGMTHLDIAKSTVERIILMRNNRDKYFLVTFEDDLEALKISWSDWKHKQMFFYELKNLEALDLTDIPAALQKSFDLLNQKRLRKGIDTFGMGRRIGMIEPATIIFITDATTVTTNTSGPSNTFEFPELSDRTGSDMYSDIFRWDQRIFSVIIAMNGIDISKEGSDASTDPILGSQIHSICERTGGNAYLIQNMKQLLKTVDNIANVKLNQIGVVMDFRPTGHAPGAVRSRKMVYVNPSPETWMIPEDFRLTRDVDGLLSRNGQPSVLYSVREVQLDFIEDFPIDKFRLESSEMTKWIINNTQSNGYFLVFLEQKNVQISDLKPFGCLKADKKSGHVYLYVLPYNFVMLFQLLRMYEKVFQANKQPSLKCRADFTQYLQGVPWYYAPILKNILHTKIPGIENVTIQDLDTNTMIYLQNVKKASAEDDERQERRLAKLRKKRNNLGKEEVSNSPDEENVALTTNVFDIERDHLLSEIDTLKKKYILNKSQSSSMMDRKHNLPISEMGDYQNIPTDQLREVIPTRPKHNFGNPFLKKGKMMKNLFSVDEAFEGLGIQDSFKETEKKRKRDTESTIENNISKKSNSNSVPLAEPKVVEKPTENKIERIRTVPTEWQDIKRHQEKITYWSAKQIN